MTLELTYDQKAIHFETYQHIHEVQKLLCKMQIELAKRSIEHDNSKIYSEEECATFADFTPKLKDLDYGSPEYKQCLIDMGPAIKHHQQSNSHHPEAHENGINGMNLIDLLEMICDWKAATLRHKNGDIRKSILMNKGRFQMSDQLCQILNNTIELLEKNV
ncbi:MAG: hypothetical protein ACD_33C00002G0030 [uncultured bacterium]|nr:MAG: hypothetical protein ACD_33C00002G0030 [uncultured bacterium]